MTYQSSVHRSVLPLILLPPLLISACGLASEQPAANGTPPAVEATSPLEPESIEVELEVGPGSFFLPDPKVGLAELVSYEETLTISFEGIESGQAQNWSSTYVMLYTNDPPASLLTITNSGDRAPADPILLAEADGAAYEIGQDGTCGADALDPENSRFEFVEPAGSLSGLFGAEELGREDLNGITADHYTFDERALLQTGIGESTGEVWVAAGGGYVLKYVLTTTGDADYFGEGVEGTISWDYSLTNVNQPIDLSLLQGCQVDAPLLSNASNVVNLPGWLRFETSSSVAEAVAFYQEQLPTLGWTQVMEPFIDATSAFLEYTNTDQTLNILIAPGDGGTRVDILLSSTQE